MIRIIQIVVLLIVTSPKYVEDHFPVRRMLRGDKFLYLTKMDFGIGEGNFHLKIKYLCSELRMTGKPTVDRELFTLKVGALLDEEYNKFLEITNCEERQKLFRDFRNLYDLQNGHWHDVQFDLHQNIREHLWYFYIYNCGDEYDKEQQNFGLRFDVQIKVTNNGSHFGEDEHITWVYVLALLIALVLIPKNLKKLIRGWRDGERDWAHVIVSLGIILLAVGYIYKLVHLFVYSANGVGVPILDIFYLVCRTLSESAIVNLLLIIGWGWTITYLNGENEELYLPIGTMATIIHIIATTLGKITDDSDSKNHHFDCATGLIVLWIRIMIVIAFVVGVMKTYRDARPKAKQFVRQFGLLGFIYLAGHPFAVLFCEIVFPAYMQHQMITFFVEITHATANGLLTYMITSKKSAYSTLDYNHRTIFTPVNGKVF